MRKDTGPSPALLETAESWAGLGNKANCKLESKLKDLNLSKTFTYFVVQKSTT